jgi:hypothetical protein
MNAIVKKCPVPEDRFYDQFHVPIETIQKVIENHSLKDTIDCQVSALEVLQEKLSDTSKEYKNYQLILQIQEAVSKAADCLDAINIRTTPENEGYLPRFEQQARRRILADLLLDIAQIKVM